MQVDLSTYNNSWYKPGKPARRLLWYFVNLIFFRSGCFPVYSLKRALLRSFGAKVGSGVLIKPHVNIKYPWFLSIGDHVWIGEEVWIDNLAQVSIGSNCCISQGAFILTGNHNFGRSTFDLMVKPVTIRDGAWIGAKSIVCPGVTAEACAVLTAGSVANQNLEAFGIYRGNPAVKIKERQID